MSRKLRHLEKKHRQLERRVREEEYDAEQLAEVRQFIGELRQAGADIAEVAERDRLRAMLRSWGTFVYEHTGKFPITDLASPRPPGLWKRMAALWPLLRRAIPALILIAIIAFLVVRRQQLLLMGRTRLQTAGILPTRFTVVVHPFTPRQPRVPAVDIAGSVVGEMRRTLGARTETQIILREQDNSYLEVTSPFLFELWGEYDQNVIDPVMVLTCTRRITLCQGVEPPWKGDVVFTVTAPLDLETFAARPFPRRMTYVAAFAVGQLFYGEEDLSQAEAAFRVALEEAQAIARDEGVPLPGEARAYLWHGRVLLAQEKYDQALIAFTAVITRGQEGVAEAYFQRGMIHNQRGNFSAAADDFQAALGHGYPDQAAAYYYLGRALFAQKAYTDCVAALSTTIEQEYYRLAEAYFWRGQAYLRLGDYEPALLDFQSALEREYHDLGAIYYGMGQAYLALGELEEAVTAYQKALEQDYDDLAAVHFGLGQAHYQLGRYPQAVTAFQAALAQGYPDTAQVLYRLGLAQMGAEDYAAAAQSLEKALAAWPEDTPPPVEGYYQLGQAYEKLGDYAAAAEAYRQALAQNPLAPAPIYLALGRVLYAQGGETLDEALQALDVALLADPALVEARYYRGLVLYALHRYREAQKEILAAVGAGAPVESLADLEALLRKLGDDCRAVPSVAFTLGRLYQTRAQEGDLPKATAAYSRTLECDPTNGHAYFWRGRAYFDLARYSPALADFTQAITYTASLSESYYWRGRTHYQIGKRLAEDESRTAAVHYQIALDDLSQAIALAPTFPAAHYWRGLLYGELGDYPAAEDDLHTALEQGYDDQAAAYYQLGRIYYAQGDYWPASVAWRQAIENGYPNPALAYYQAGMADFWRGVYHEEHEGFDDAVSAFMESIRLDPARFEQARQEFTRLAEESTDPATRAAAYYLRGRLLYNQPGEENLQAAAADFAQAVQLDPSLMAAYYWLGLTNYALGDYEAAITNLQTSQQRGEGDPASYYWLGRAYFDQGNYAQAVNAFTQALTGTVAGEALYWQGRAYYALGQEQEAAGDPLAVQSYEQAITDLTEAISRTVELAAAHYWRGIVFIALGAYQEAVADFDAALEAGYQPPEDAFYRRGLAYYHLAQSAVVQDAASVQAAYQEAVLSFSEVITRRQDFADAYYWRGRAAYALVQMERLDPELAEQNRLLAIADLEKYLELAPTAPDRPQVETWLQELRGDEKQEQ